MARAAKPSTRPDRALGVSTPSVTQLKVLDTFVKQAIRLQDEIILREAKLAERNADLHRLTHGEIPEAMMAAGVTEFKTEDGLIVTVGDFVAGTMPKREEDGGAPGARKAMFKWLIKNAPGIVKEEVAINFSVGEREQSERLKALLKANGYEHFFAEVNVNHQTLSAFARELIRKGQKLPDLLGIFIDHKAVIKLPKAKGTK